VTDESTTTVPTMTSSVELLLKLDVATVTIPSERYVGDMVGANVGAPGVGASVGAVGEFVVGALLGEALGIGVGLLAVYVGTRVGSTVGAAVGAEVGFGVGAPTLVKTSDVEPLDMAALSTVTVPALTEITVIVVELASLPLVTVLPTVTEDNAASLLEMVLLPAVVDPVTLVTTPPLR